MPNSFKIQRVLPGAGDNVFLQMAQVHVEQIDRGFLTSLGPAFLTRLYQSIAATPHAFVYAAFDRDDVAGFICGSFDTRKVYRSFLLRAGLPSLPLLLRKSLSTRHIRRFWETWRYPSQRVAAELPPAEILNFCVSGSFQRRGVGRQLFAALVEEYRRRQVSEIKIVTGVHQHSAQRFYEAGGAKLASRIEIHRGDESLVYRFAIPSLGGTLDSNRVLQAA